MWTKHHGSRNTWWMRVVPIMEDKKQRKQDTGRNQGKI
jgi:hypothetical protein